MRLGDEPALHEPRTDGHESACYRGGARIPIEALHRRETAAYLGEVRQGSAYFHPGVTLRRKVPGPARLGRRAAPETTAQQIPGERTECASEGTAGEVEGAREIAFSRNS